MEQVPSSQATAPSTPPASTPPASTAPYRADWYPDPTGRFEFRYHNGQIWTGDVSVDGNRFLDPLPLGTTWPQQRSAGVAHVPLVGSGRARAAFVLGLCSLLVGWVPFLCVVAIGAAIVALVLGLGALRRDARARRDGRGDSRGHGQAVAGVILAPLGLAVSVLGVWLSVLAIREVQTFTNVGAHTTSDTSCVVRNGTATYTGSITNESRETHSYEITVEFRRPGTSVRLHIASTSVTDVEPGGTAIVTVSEVVPEEQLDCSVYDVTGPLPFGQS